MKANSKLFLTGVKKFGPVQNNETIINAINNLKTRIKTFSVFTFDLFTLFINITHHRLKS